MRPLLTTQRRLPTTSPDVWADAADTNWGRRLLDGDQPLPDRFAQRLAATDNADVVRAAAAWVAALDDDTLLPDTVGAWGAGPEFASPIVPVATNPNLPENAALRLFDRLADALDRLGPLTEASSNFHIVEMRDRLMPRLPPDRLLELGLDPPPAGWVREVVTVELARRGESTPATLRTAASRYDGNKDPSRATMLAVAQAASSRHDLHDHPDTLWAVRAAARSHWTEARCAVARQLTCGCWTHLLTSLVDDGTAVRREVARNRALPTAAARTLLDDRHPRVRKVARGRDDLLTDPDERLEHLLNDTNGKVRAKAVTGHADRLTDPQMVRLSRDRARVVRTTVAGLDRRLPDDAYRLLVDSGDREVLDALADNHHRWMPDHIRAWVWSLTGR